MTNHKASIRHVRISYVSFTWLRDFLIVEANFELDDRCTCKYFDIWINRIIIKTHESWKVRNYVSETDVKARIYVGGKWWRIGGMFTLGWIVKKMIQRVYVEIWNVWYHTTRMRCACEISKEGNFESCSRQIEIFCKRQYMLITTYAKPNYNKRRAWTDWRNCKMNTREAIRTKKRRVF